MRCPTLDEIPPPPPGKTGWPWSEDTPLAPETMPDGKPWPCFSIVTPSYNQGAFLEETIRSILLQGYPQMELMVIDGGSQDGSLEIIRKYEPWLAYWVSEPDRGQSHAINKGWDRASGDLLAYLNSDDFYFPSAFRRVAEAWSSAAIEIAQPNRPPVSVITGSVMFTDELTRPRSEHKPFVKSQPAQGSAGHSDARPSAATHPLIRYVSVSDLSLLPPWAWYLPQQATFFIGERLDRAERRLREDLHYTMDRELMYRMCRQGAVLLVPDEILAGDRHHSQSKRLSKVLQMYREDAAALEYCAWGDGRDRRQRQRVARWRLAQGHYHFANQAPSRLSAVLHYTLAAFYRPEYLRRRGFWKRIGERISGWEADQRMGEQTSGRTA